MTAALWHNTQPTWAVAAALAVSAAARCEPDVSERWAGTMRQNAADESAADAELVRRTVRGDASAFEALAARYYRPVGGFVLKRVGRSDLVEDLVQETFLEAFRALKSGRQPEHFSSWLFGIAHNRCGKWLRRARILTFKAGPPSEEIADPAPPSPLEEIEEQRHLLRRLEAGLAELPEETRNLLALKHREGKTCAQIAAETGRPVGTVKSVLSRAYGTLRSWVKPEGEG